MDINAKNLLLDMNRTYESNGNAPMLGLFDGEKESADKLEKDGFIIHMGNMWYRIAQKGREWFSSYNKKD